VSDEMWYYAVDSEQRGPVSREDLGRLATSGAVTPQTLVWREGMANWLAAGTLAGLLTPSNPATAPLNYAEPASLDSSIYAGFWRRFCAWVIDRLIFYVPFHLINTVLGLTQFVPTFGRIGRVHRQPLEIYLGCGSGLIEYVAWWLYFALMESSELQATVGKMALGLRVTDLMGQRISFGRACGRFFGKIVSALTLAIGYMMAGWTQRKQALHDMMADTLVIKK
jgi:uncharacterized RDD family membrane protein YckC